MEAGRAIADEVVGVDSSIVATDELGFQAVADSDGLKKPVVCAVFADTTEREEGNVSVAERGLARRMTYFERFLRKPEDLGPVDWHGEF